MGIIRNKIFYLEQKYIEKRNLSKKHLGEVWMFHCITNNRSLWYDEEYSISSDTFFELIDHYKKEGYEFKSINDLDHSTEKCIYITFDDGFEGIYTEAMKGLQERNIPFCVFVTTDFLGQKGYLSTEMVVELAKEPLCIIGAHTITHPVLRRLKKEQAEKEIAGAKNIIESMIEDPVYCFAYPYGNLKAVGNREKKIAERCGFKYVFSTIQTPLTKESVIGKDFIPRININETNAVHRFSRFEKDAV